MQANFKEQFQGTDGATWNTAFLTKLAKLLAKNSILLKPPDTNAPYHAPTTLKRRRRAALQVTRALSPLQYTPVQLFKVVDRFIEIYKEKRGAGDLPAWARPVARHMARVHPSPRADPAEAVLRALTERARELRCTAAGAVCRALEEAPRARAADLQRVWERMVAAVRAKLDALVAGGDSETGLQAGARLSRAEWRLVDTLLLFDETGALRVVREEHARRAEPLRALVAVFHLVQLYHLEGGGGTERGGWRAAAAAYRRRGRLASAVLLQRRWHDLKLQTRARLWRAARDADGPAPAPLHLAVARRYPNVALAPLPAWRQRVADGAVLEECDLTADVGSPEEAPEPDWTRLESPLSPRRSTRERALPAAAVAEAEDDLILVEREIETVDLLAADDDDDDDTGKMMDIEEEKISIKREVVESPEQNVDMLRARRREMALALERELDRQLQDLEKGRGHMLPPVPATSPLIVYDSDESVTQEQRPGSGGRDPGPEHKGQGRTEDDSGDEVTSKEGEDEELTIDVKLLMETRVPLMRVDAAGWRDLLPPTALAPASAPTPALAPAPPAFTPRELVDELLGGAQGGIRIVSVKSEETSGCEGEGEGAGETETEASRRGRVRLPDIAEVRRIHRRMKTAQVAPLTAAPAPAHEEEEYEGELRIDEGSEGEEVEEGGAQSGGGEQWGALTSGELRRVLRACAGGVQRAPPPSPAGARWRDLYCCAARYHRALNDARRRCAVRGGRAPPPDAPVHAARCAPATAPAPGVHAPRPQRESGGAGACACCCAHLLDAEGAARALAAERAHLLRDVRAILAGASPSPGLSPSPTPLSEPAESAAKPGPRRSKKPKKKKSKRDRTPHGQYADLPPAPAEDPLQEWIRQKNIASRFFDLNLKKPPPRLRPPPPPPPPVAIPATAPHPQPTIAPVQTPVVPRMTPVQQTLVVPTMTPVQQNPVDPTMTPVRQIPVVPMMTAVQQTPVFPTMAPVQQTPIVPMTPVQQTPILPTPVLSTSVQTPVVPMTPVQQNPILPTPILPTSVQTPVVPRMTPVVVTGGMSKNVNKVKVTVNTKSGSSSRSLLLKCAERERGKGSVTVVRRMHMTEYLKRVVKRARLVAVNAGAGGGAALPANAIPVTMLQTAAGVRLMPLETRAPVPRTDEVIDLCEDEPSPPRSPCPSPSSSPPTPPSHALLRKLPPGISVKRKEAPLPPPPDPKAQKILSSLPPGIQVKRSVVVPVRVPAPAAPATLLNESMSKQPIMQVSPVKNGNSNIKVFKISEDGRLTPKGADSARPPPPAPISTAPKKTKLVLIPRKGREGGMPPKLLNSLFADAKETNTKLKISELRTADGKRLLMMRPPANGQPTKLTATDKQQTQKLSDVSKVRRGGPTDGRVTPPATPHASKLAPGAASSPPSSHVTFSAITMPAVLAAFTPPAPLPAALNMTPVSMMSPPLVTGAIVSMANTELDFRPPAKIVKLVVPAPDKKQNAAKIAIPRLMPKKSTATFSKVTPSTSDAPAAPSMDAPAAPPSDAPAAPPPEDLENICKFETSPEDVTPQKKEEAREVFRLDGGATVRRAEPTYDLSERRTRWEEWAAGAGAHAAVQVCERGAPLYRVGALAYYVRTSRPLPFARAAIWTLGPEASVERVAVARAPSVRRHGSAYYLEAAGARVRGEWACRSAREVAAEARAGALLHVVHARTGRAHPLRPARPPRPDLLALRCQYLAAAQQITQDVNKFAKNNEVGKQSYVRIAPRPPPAPPAPANPAPAPASPAPAPARPGPLSFKKAQMVLKKFNVGQSLLRPVVADDRAEKSPSTPATALVRPETAPVRPETAPVHPKTAPSRPETAPVQAETVPARPVSPPARPETPPEPRRSSRRAAHDARAKLSDIMNESTSGGKGDGGKDKYGDDEGLDFSTAAGLEAADSDDDYNAVDDLRRERTAARRRGRRHVSKDWGVKKGGRFDIEDEDLRCEEKSKEDDEEEEFLGFEEGNESERVEEELGKETEWKVLEEDEGLGEFEGGIEVDEVEEETENKIEEKMPEEDEDLREFEGRIEVEKEIEDSNEEGGADMEIDDDLGGGIIH